MEASPLSAEGGVWRPTSWIPSEGQSGGCKMQSRTLSGLTKPLLLAAVLLSLIVFAPSVADAADSDGDGIDDTVDNCPAVFNPEQRNTDADLNAAGSSFAGDADGDACDTDDDNDGLLDTLEHFVGTDALNNCSVTLADGDEPVDADPRDMTDNQRINTFDLIPYNWKAQHVRARPGVQSSP